MMGINWSYKHQYLQESNSVTFLQILMFVRPILAHRSVHVIHVTFSSAPDKTFGNFT